MINLENINLNYKDTKALKDITIEFPEHGICGLLGRNGAGKTSTVTYKWLPPGNIWKAAATLGNQKEAVFNCETLLYLNCLWSLLNLHKKQGFS